MSLIGKTVTFVDYDFGQGIFKGTILDKVSTFHIVDSELPSGQGEKYICSVPVTVDKYLVKTKSKLHTILPRNIKSVVDLSDIDLIKTLINLDSAAMALADAAPTNYKENKVILFADLQNAHLDVLEIVKQINTIK